MKRGPFVCGCACIVLTLSSAAGLVATLSAQAGSVTVEGCVVKEVDAPGRIPPEEEMRRVVLQNNFVLTNTTVTQGAAPVADGETDAPSLMYMIKEIKKPELSKHVGHKVKIEGTLDKVGRAKNPVSFAGALVELKGTTITMLAESCTAK